MGFTTRFTALVIKALSSMSRPARSFTSKLDNDSSKSNNDNSNDSSKSNNDNSKSSNNNDN